MFYNLPGYSTLLIKPLFNPRRYNAPLFLILREEATVFPIN